MSRVQRWAKQVVDGERLVVPALVAFSLVGGLSLAVGETAIDTDVVGGLVGVATFLFGVLVAFAIDRTRDRLGRINELLKRGDSQLLAIDSIVAVFGDVERERVRELLDAHLIEQLDYVLADYHRSAGSYRELVASIRDLEPESTREEIAYDHLLGLTIGLGESRTLVEAVARQGLSAVEWAGLTVLLALQVALVAVLVGGSALGGLVAGTFGAVLVTLMLLLRRLDRLSWQEDTWIWAPVERLFLALDRVPYLPRQVIEAKRYRPHGQVRVADYPDGYPVMDTKVVTLEEYPG